MTAALGHVFVTGATGFLGSAVVRVLCARGARVHALVRAGSDRGALADLRVTFHEGDLERPAAVAAALQAARVAAGGGRLDAVHSAAVISYRTRDAELQRRVNVDGTRAVLEACRAAGVARLLHVSSVVAIGHAEGGGPIDEDHPFNGGGLRVDYVDTKRAAEELALAADGFEVVSVNPGAIFGPLAAGSNTAKFVIAVRERRAGPFAPPGGISVVGRDDAAEGCVLALERGRPGRRYALTERYCSVLELFRLVAAELDVRPPRGALPRPLWRAAGFLVGLVDRLRPLELATPQALRMVGARFDVSGARAREELGWRPSPFPEVLRAILSEAAPDHG